MNTTAPTDSHAVASTSGFDASVPAVNVCTVAVTHSTKLSRWTLRHSRFGTRRPSSDVTSTASST